MNKRLILLLLTSLVLNSCLDLQHCNNSIEGRYYCNNNESAINYLEILNDGTFIHYYKEEDVELSHYGTWKNNDDYCKIELNEWKNYNQEGKSYREFGNGILFINGNYLDISPDGKSSMSFKKE